MNALAHANDARCVITGTGLQLGGIASPLEWLAASPAAPAEPFDPRAVLGRKGLFGKDTATLLALCAAKHALAQAAWPESGGTDPARIGVVVASNFGNLDTVERVLKAVAAGGAKAASMMDAPNASSNVIASTLAIRFGFKGPNYTVCSGGTASIDALRIARLTLAAGRADAVLVVGVEPRNPVVSALVEPWLGDAGARLAEGAAALVIERASAAAERGAAGLFRIGGTHRLRAVPAVPRRALGEPPHPVSRWLTFGDAGVAAAQTVGLLPTASASAQPHVVDLEARLGACHGLLAIAQAVLACALPGVREPGSDVRALLHAGAPYEAESALAVLEPLGEAG